MAKKGIVYWVVFAVFFKFWWDFWEKDLGRKNYE